MAEYSIRLLARDDRRSGFSSGDVELDRFFLRYAGQNQFRHHIGTTYVAVADEFILGFVTVSPGELASEVPREQLPGRLPDYPLPVLRIARLAVDARARGRGVGRSLLRFVLRLGVEMRDRYGCIGLVVDAKPAATSFYVRLGFQALTEVRGGLGDRPKPTPMFLPIQRVMEAVSDNSAD